MTACAASSSADDLDRQALGRQVVRKGAPFALGLGRGADHPVGLGVEKGGADRRGGGMGHDRPLEVGAEQDGDRIGGPVACLDQLARLLDQKLRRTAGQREDSAHRAGDRAHGGAGFAERPAGLEWVRSVVDRLGQSLHGFSGKPACAVGPVGGD